MGESIVVKQKEKKPGRKRKLLFKIGGESSQRLHCSWALCLWLM